MMNNIEQLRKISEQQGEDGKSWNFREDAATIYEPRILERRTVSECGEPRLAGMTLVGINKVSSIGVEREVRSTLKTGAEDYISIASNEEDIAFRLRASGRSRRSRPYKYSVCASPNRKNCVAYARKTSASLGRINLLRTIGEF